MSDRTVEEDVQWWLGEPEDAIDPLLPHLTDQDIYGLGDSYDDPRIDTLTECYVTLRQRFQALNAQLFIVEYNDEDLGPG